VKPEFRNRVIQGSRNAAVRKIKVPKNTFRVCMASVSTSESAERTESPGYPGLTGYILGSSQRHTARVPPSKINPRMA